MKKFVVLLLTVTLIATSAFASGAEESDGFTIAGIYKMGDAEWFLQEGEASRTGAVPVDSPVEAAQEQVA